MLSICRFPSASVGVVRAGRNGQPERGPAARSPPRNTWGSTLYGKVQVFPLPRCSTEACSLLTAPTVPITQPGSGAGHWRTQQGKAAPAESGDGASPTDAWRHWVEINTSATFDYHLILSYHLIRGVARTGRRAASINGTVTFSNQSGHSLMVSLSLGTQG